MTRPGQLQDEQHDALAAKVGELSIQLAASTDHFQKSLETVATRLSELEAASGETVDIDPPAPDPVPEPTQPAVPAVPATPSDVPTPPTATHTIRVKSGRVGDIRSKLKNGHVNRVVGPRDAEFWIQGAFNGLRLIVDGPSCRKVVRAPGGEVWFNHAESRGTSYKGPGSYIDPAPTLGCKRTVHIGGIIKRMRRGNSGPVEMYGTRLIELYEDGVAGGGKLRNVLIERLAYPEYVKNEKKEDVHPDILQGPGVWDVDGLTVRTYRGQNFALASRWADGTQIKNVDISGDQGTGIAMHLEHKSNGSLSNAYFENIVSDKSFIVRGPGAQWAWQGNNVRFKNCRFSNVYLEDQTLNSEASA